MEKLCYAIMPYGGTEQELIDRFNAVYQLYMLIPATEKGFSVIREDIQAQPGSITTNIIHHLAEAELVIADLSNRNWNVAYELGIRHSLVKGKTILLCDNETDLAFDIRGFNVIRYDGNNPAGNMFAIQDLVRKAIVNRMKKTVKADNLVHETFTFAHDNLTDYLKKDEEADMVDELNRLKATCENLEAENERLQKKMQEFGTTSNDISNGQESIGLKIEEAMRTIQYSGDNAVLNLRQAFSKPELNYNEIRSILQQSLAEGYLTEGNFRSMYHLFHAQNQPQLTNLILEIAEQRYPSSLDFKSYLADAYSDNYATRDKAIQYADEVLEVTTVDGKRYSNCQKIDSDQLGACLNAYIGVRHFDAMIELIPQLLDQIPEHREMLLRNLATAFREVGNSSKQLETLEVLLKEYPMNDVNHYRVFGCLRKMNQQKQAFYHLELAAALDPDDVDYLFALAGVIFDEHFSRTEDGILRKKVRKEECAKAAMPFLMQAMQIEPSNQCKQRCINFILQNNVPKYQTIFEQWIENGMENCGIPELDYHGVDYLIYLTKNLESKCCDEIYVTEEA